MVAFATGRSARSLLFVGCAALGACGTAPPRARDAAQTPSTHEKNTPAPRACLIAAGATRLSPVGRQGSAVALARAAERLVAYVANRHAKRLDVVDVKSHTAVGAIALQGAPDQVLVLPEGRLVVSLGNRAALEAISVGSDLQSALEKSCLVDVPRGPAGLALSEDGKKLVVASTLDGSISILDAKTLIPERRVALSRSPKSVVVESARAFVSHLAGDHVSVVDLESASEPRNIELGMLPATEQAPEYALTSTRRTAQAYSLVSVELAPEADGGKPLVGRLPRHAIVVPEVSVDPGDDRRSNVYYGPPPTAGIPKEAPIAVRVDVDSERRVTSRVLSLGSASYARECLLPRASAFRSSTARLYVACRGIDELLELDARAVDPMRSIVRRFDISKGVTGIAVADEEGIGVAFGEFDRTLDIVTLADGKRQEVNLAANASALSTSYRMGQELFYRSSDPRIAFDGLACASCHPEGGEDGLTWSTPEGPRQTPMLAGRVHGTGPYGWTRAIGTLPGYIQNTIARLGGLGIRENEAVALASYLERMPSPESSSTAAASAEEVEHGRDLFQRTGCAACHAGPLTTDASFHAVAGDRYATPFDTPSLRFVGMTAPYFHDGRYPNLEELLSDPKSTMGSSAQLSTADRKDLESFLESL